MFAWHFDSCVSEGSTATVIGWAKLVKCRLLFPNVSFRACRFETRILTVVGMSRMDFFIYMGNGFAQPGYRYTMPLGVWLQCRDITDARYP